jgi:hypothetical protein
MRPRVTRDVKGNELMTGFAHGIPNWADLSVSDLDAGKWFYGELFGWTFTDVSNPRGRYTLAFNGEHNVAALVPQQTPDQEATWTVYLAAADAQATAARIKNAGGQILAGPAPVGELGTMALVTDPAGARFGLWQPGTHQGFQQTRSPGSFTWTEAHVPDADVADAFYEGVFGYTTMDAGPELRLWAPAGTEFGPATAFGGRKLLADTHAVPYFEPYFAVADCDATAEAAAKLGGTVLKAPFDTPFGRLAILTDSQGAVFVTEAR